MRKTGRTVSKIESEGIAEELKELRKVMEEMVVVLKKLAGMERREGVGQKNAGVEVRTERKGGEEESRVEGERRIKEERSEWIEGRKVEESTIGKWKEAEIKKEEREETEEGMERGETSGERKRIEAEEEEKAQKRKEKERKRGERR